MIEIVFDLKREKTCFDVKFGELDVIMKEVLARFNTVNFNVAKIKEFDFSSSSAGISRIDIEFEVEPYPYNGESVCIKVKIRHYSEYKDCWNQKCCTIYDKHHVITAERVGVYVREGRFQNDERYVFLWPIGKFTVE